VADHDRTSGERMGDNIRDTLSERAVFEDGDVSFSWVLAVRINQIDGAGRLRGRTVMLCMKDIDPDTLDTLITRQAASTEQPLL
jgi:hypothetical protein